MQLASLWAAQLHGFLALTSRQGDQGDRMSSKQVHTAIAMMLDTVVSVLLLGSLNCAQ